MCYAQVGEMMMATFITLLLAPVTYSIFVLNLKLIKWEATGTAKKVEPEAAPRLEAPATGDRVIFHLSFVIGRCQIPNKKRPMIDNQIMNDA
jgi:hypothetical protein